MFDRLARGLLAPLNTGAIIILGVYTLVWGLWIANPWWTVFSQAPLYSAMHSLAPETFWGVVAMAAGSTMIYGVLKPSYKTLTRGAYVAGFHWLIVSILYFMGDWMNTGGITSFMLAIYALFVYLNVKINFVTHHVETHRDTHKKGGE